MTLFKSPSSSYSLKRIKNNKHFSNIVRWLKLLGILVGFWFMVGYLVDIGIVSEWLAFVLGLSFSLFIGMALGDEKILYKLSSNRIWKFEPIIMDFIFDSIWNVGVLAVAYVVIGVLFLDYDLSYLKAAIISNIPILLMIGIIMSVFGIRNSRSS